MKAPAAFVACSETSFASVTLAENSSAVAACSSAVVRWTWEESAVDPRAVTAVAAAVPGPAELET
eukprot:753235-Hanusia_phi.AAC.3